MTTEKPSIQPGAAAASVSWENVERASRRTLEQRRAAGEIMTYAENGWVVREYPGGRVERLAPLGTFQADDFPIDP